MSRELVRQRSISEGNAPATDSRLTSYAADVVRRGGEIRDTEVPGFGLAEATRRLQDGSAMRHDEGMNRHAASCGGKGHPAIAGPARLRVAGVQVKAINFDQNYEDNKAAFIERLVAAGWSSQDAEREYEQIQADEDE